MSIEAIVFYEQQTDELIEHEPSQEEQQELLIQRRIAIQRELGEVSTTLCSAQSRYTELISETIQINGELAASGIDTNQLARALKPAKKEPRRPARHLRIVE